MRHRIKMALRKIVFHQPDRTEIVEVLGFGYTIVAALKKYNVDLEAFRDISIVFDDDKDKEKVIDNDKDKDKQRQRMQELMHESVDDHLKRRMTIFPGNGAASISIEFR